MEESESQAKIDTFISQNCTSAALSSTQSKKTKKIKRGKRKHSSIFSNCPKVLVVTGNDTLLLRDYILNDLKSNYNLRI